MKIPFFIHTNVIATEAEGIFEEIRWVMGSSVTSFLPDGVGVGQEVSYPLKSKS